MYDHEQIKGLRNDGWEWGEIAVAHYPGKTGNAVRKAHSRWEDRTGGADSPDEPHSDVRNESISVSGRDFSKVENLDDIVEFFDVDTEVWEAVTIKVGGSVWDQSVEKGTVAQSVRIDATFKRIKFSEDDARRVWEEFYEDAENHAPSYDAVPRQPLTDEDDPVLLELSIVDPHFGMLAHGREVGGPDQDIYTIQEDYSSAVDRMLGVHGLYPVEKILYIVGHDSQHVNQVGQGGKGGTTRAGTAQDLDTRLHKIYTTLRRCVVEGVDKARMIAPVDVVVVPGNHDKDVSYYLGETLYAWYRNDPEVTVDYGPNRNKFYNYHKNTFMLTHGEEYNRKRDNLVTIMATECPAEWWVASEDGIREIHTGHNHRKLQGGYYPTAEVSESRGVRTISLPGLTAVDAWHHESGYRHRRGATVMAYRRSASRVDTFEFAV